MHSISTPSPTFDLESRSPFRRSVDLQRDQPAPRMYSVDSCINCGHQYEYGKLKYELGGDAKMLWKRFSSVVTDHYYSCPKKFANIHQPTSAIRGTLSEPHEARRMESKKAKSSLHYSPYSRNPPRHDRHMDVGSSRVEDSLSTLPDPPLTAVRQKVPLRLESSNIIAEQIRSPLTKPPPRRVDRVSETQQRSSDMEKSQLLQPLRQHTPHSAYQAVVNDEPALASFPSSGVLPPVWNRKRKRAQLQETVNVNSCPPLDDVVNLRPHSTPLISIQRHASPGIASVTEDTEPWSPSSIDGELEERPTKKEKKNVMDWRLRRKHLMQDPLLCGVEAKRVCCRPCHKWIKLDARNDFYPGLWLKHRRTMHGSASVNSPYSDSGRRRRSKPEDEEIVTRKRNDESGRTCHEQTRQTCRGAVSTSMRSHRSSLRITRSSSGASV